MVCDPFKITNSRGLTVHTGLSQESAAPEHLSGISNPLLTRPISFEVSFEETSPPLPSPCPNDEVLSPAKLFDFANKFDLLSVRKFADNTIIRRNRHYNRIVFLRQDVYKIADVFFLKDPCCIYYHSKYSCLPEESMLLLNNRCCSLYHKRKNCKIFSQFIEFSIISKSSLRDRTISGSSTGGDETVSKYMQDYFPIGSRARVFDHCKAALSKAHEHKKRKKRNDDWMFSDVDDSIHSLKWMSTSQGLMDFATPKVGLDESTSRLLSDVNATASSLVDLFSSMQVVPELSTLNKFLSDNVNVENGEKSFLMKLKIFFSEKSIPDLIFEHALGASSVVAFVSASIHYLYTNDRTSLLLAIGSGVSAVLYCTGTIQGIISYLHKLIKKGFGKSESEAQMDLGDVDDMCVGLTALLTTTLFANAKDGTKISSIVKDLSRFGSIKNSLMSIFKLCLKMFQSCYDYCKTELFDGTPFRFIKTGSSAVNEFVEVCDGINADLCKQKFSYTMSNLSRLDLAISLGKKLQREVGKESDYRDLLKVISDEMFELKRIHKLFIAANPALEGIHQEATGFLLKGGPGNLKSQSVVHFCNAILARLLTPEEWIIHQEKQFEYIYNCQPENKYWEGIESNKRIVLFDDLLQVRDVPGEPDCESMKIIRGINPLPYLLHMAELSAKGKTFANWDLLIATTNSLTTESNSIISVEAMMRRFHKSYIMSPLPEYLEKATDYGDLMKHKVDFTKLPKGILGEASAHPKYMRFIEIDPLTNAQTGKVLTFDEVVSEILDHMKTQKLRHQQYLLELQETGDKWRSSSQGRLTFHNANDEIPMEEIDELSRLSEDEDIDFVLRQLQKILATPTDPDFHEYVMKCHLVQAFVMRNSITPLVLGDLAVLIMCIEKRGEFFLHAFVEYRYQQLEEYLQNLDDKIVFSEMDIPSIIYKSPGILERIKDFWNGFCDQSYEWFKSTWLYSLSAVESLTDSYAGIFKLVGIIVGITAAGGGLFMLGRSSVAPSFNDDLCCDVLYNSLLRGNFDEIDEIMSNIAERPFQVFRSTFAKLAIEHPKSFEAIMSCSQSGESIAKGRARPAKFKSSKSIRQLAKTTSQDGGLSNSSLLMESIRARNLWEFHIQKNERGDTMHSGFIMMICGTYGLLPYHFIRVMHEHCERDESLYKWLVTVIRGTTTLQFDFRSILSNHRADILGANDICIVKLDGVFQPCKNIIKHFLRSADFSASRIMPFEIAIPKHNRVFSGNCSILTKEHTVQNEIVGTYDILHSVFYQAPTVKGDCGLPVYTTKNSLGARTIIGIHLAGNTDVNFGYAGIATQEDIEEEMKSFEDAFIISDESISGSTSQDLITIGDGRFTTLCRGKKVTQAMKTRILPSKAVSHLWEPLCMPAKLRKFTIEGIVIDPLQLALRNYCLGNIYMQKSYLNIVGYAVYDYLERRSDVNVVRRIYSSNEAVLGLEGDKDFKSIPRSTSAGYPYNTKFTPGLKGKQIFLGTEEQYNTTSSEYADLMCMVDSLIDDCKNGNRQLIVFTDVLKDEKRKIDRALSGKTRLFSGGSIVYLIAFRKYFGAFMLWLQKNRIYNTFSVGVNCYSLEWHKLAAYLLQSGDEECFGAGDYKHFDGSEKVPLLKLILLIINRWYDDGTENAQIREVLWLEVWNSRHIIDDVIYEWYSSLPSGHPMTLNINNMYNLICFHLVWFEIVDKDYKLLTEFEYYVKLAFCGDDNLFSVRKEYRLKFNEYSISQVLKKYGLTYTSEDKSEAKPVLRNIRDVEFMKRSFRWCDLERRYVAPLRLSALLETPLWTKRGDDCDRIAADNIKLTIRELALHGREIFEEYCPILSEALKEVFNEWPESTSFDTVYHTVLNSEAFFDF